MVQRLLALAEKLESKGKHKEHDEVVAYLSEFAHECLSDKLLLLEKAGVDTSEYYNKLVDESIGNEDIEAIQQKFEVNCPKGTSNDLEDPIGQYVDWMGKKKPDKQPEDHAPVKEEVSELRQSFIDFLSDVVAEDYKENTDAVVVEPEKLIQYYLENAEGYKEQLDNYNLLLGHAEGIVSDEDFVDELRQHPDFDDSDMVRRAE